MGLKASLPSGLSWGNLSLPKPNRSFCTSHLELIVGFHRVTLHGQTQYYRHRKRAGWVRSPHVFSWLTSCVPRLFSAAEIGLKPSARPAGEKPSIRVCTPSPIPGVCGLRQTPGISVLFSPQGVGPLGRGGGRSRAPRALRTLVKVYDSVCLQAGILDADVVLQQEGPLMLKEVIHLLREPDRTHLHQVTGNMSATDTQGWQISV